MAETLVGVHTHTHTHTRIYYGILLNEKSQKEVATTTFINDIVNQDR